MRYLYRHYRINPIDSIWEMTLCDSLDMIKQVVAEKFSKNGLILTKDDVIVDEEFTPDEVTGWLSARCVSISRLKGIDLGFPQCVGMCCDEDHLPDGDMRMIENALKTNTVARIIRQM